MKLSKLYSNKPDVFSPIIFNDGFNVVYADIRHPQDKKKDTHNLGKTTLAKLLDFTFLARRDKEQFLFKHYKLFEPFEFYLEILLDERNYLTIKRGVSSNTKISFISHTEPNKNYTQLTEGQWTHFELPFEKARHFFDEKLAFDIPKNYSYRMVIGYFIRTQYDYQNVFKLDRHRSKDLNWKPFMADLLGFSGELARKHYEKEAEINEIKIDISKQAKFNPKQASQELSKATNKILLRTKSLDEMRAFVDKFNFEQADQAIIESLVSEIDSQIADANMTEYTIRNHITRVEESIKSEKINFKTSEVEALFSEANILFPNQIVKDFDQLIEFNQSITKERNDYLQQELKDLKADLINVKKLLTNLNHERSQRIGYLAQTNLVAKFKEANSNIAEMQAELITLNQQKDSIEKILNLENSKKDLKAEIEHIETQIQENISLVEQNEEGIFTQIRILFNDIIKRVLNKEGALTVYLNDSNHFEFDAAYYDEKGNPTSESDGNSYKKFLCIAFDLAVARAYLSYNFPKVVFIDGVFDGLDNRKKELLLEILHEYSKFGLQIIITVINSQVIELGENVFNKDEIIVSLHDDGRDGRLFKMESF